MGARCRVTHEDGLYFVTTTVIGWVDVFTRPELAEVVTENLQFCQKNKGLVIHGWCLMPNHLHMIVRAEKGKRLSDIMRDFKKFTSKKIVQLLSEIVESRTWMLSKFRFAGLIHPKSTDFKFWRDGYHPILLYSEEFIEQKLNYIHENPVKAGYVEVPEHYRYSSAIDIAME